MSGDAIILTMKQRLNKNYTKEDDTLKNVTIRHEGNSAALRVLSAVKNFASGVGWLAINNQ